MFLNSILMLLCKYEKPRRQPRRTILLVTGILAMKVEDIKATRNLSDVAIFVPILNDWASVVGACMEDGNLRLICKSDDGKTVLLAPDTVQILFNCFHVPF